MFTQRDIYKFHTTIPTRYQHTNHFTRLSIDKLRYFLFPRIRNFIHTIPSLASCRVQYCHYSDVIMGAIASQITSLTIIYSTVYSDADQKHQSSASLAFVRGIHRGPVNSPHKWSGTRKMFPFDDAIMVVLRVDKSRVRVRIQGLTNSVFLPCQSPSGDYAYCFQRNLDLDMI